MSESMWSLLRGESYGKFYTLNFDGSHNNQANKSGAGCIIRDNQGEFVLAAAYSLTESYPDYCNVAIAEAMALLNGLKLAKENNLRINLIRGDSKEVIDYVLNRSPRPAKPPLNEIIHQIIGMIDRLSQKIEIVDRETNKIADKLAFWGSSRLPGGLKLYTNCADLPPQVAELIIQEKSCDRMKEVDDGGSSSMASNIGMAGAAVAGAAVLAWGISKLFGDTSSDDQEHHKKNAKGLWSYVMDATQNYESKSSEMGSSKLMVRESYYGYDHDEEHNKLKAKAPWTYGLDNIRNSAPKWPQINEIYTLNFDGSHINQLQKGGAGCIIRNKQRDLVIAAAYNLNNLYPNQLNVAVTEAIGLRNGLKLAKNKNVKLYLIEGDSKEVIDRILGRERKPSRVPFLNEIIHDTKEALHDQSIDPETQLNLIERDANRVADELASIGSKLECEMEKTYDRDEVLTFKIAQLIQKDKSAMGILK